MRLFNWGLKLSQVKKKPLALSLIVLMSLTTPLFTSNPAFAANPSPASTDANYLNWNIQSNWYRQAISKCLANYDLYPVKSDSDVKSANWWSAPGFGDYNSSYAVTGYYMRDTLGGIGDDGSSDCWENNNELLTKAFQLWGLDGLTVACGANIFVRINGNDCIKGSGDFKPAGSKSDMANRFRDYIKNTINGGQEPQLDDAMQFVLYRRTLIMGCAYANQTPQTTNPGGSNVYAIASFYNGTADNLNPNASVQQQSKLQQTTAYYIGDQSPTTERWLWTNPDSQKTCQELADAIAPNSAYASAYATYAEHYNVDPTLGVGPEAQNNPASDSSNCTIPGIGWIVCPVTTFLAGVADQVYNVIEKLLTVSPLNTDTMSPSNGTYIAWAYARNIANVVFVIVFVFIIYSQLTGIGVTNYGIKKLLPRLIVAAVLVNASYWICAIAVDLSNILGVSVRGLLDAAAMKMPVPPATDPLSHGGVWQGITVAILASVGVAILGLTILLPILIAALAAAITVLIVLVLRQALIIMLIFVAPLAFVAYLLPNTEKWFDRWRETFTTLLLLFPIISLVFGGANLASRVLTASSLTIEGDSQGWFIKIVAAGVTVIPLFIVPILMKASGGLLSRFAGVVNNPNKGMFDRMRKGAEGIRKDRENVRNMRALSSKPQFQMGRGAFVRWRARQRAISSGRESEMNRANTEYLADQSRTNENFRNAAAGGTNYMGSPLKMAGAEAANRSLANAINVQAKLEADEVTAANAIIEKANLSSSQKQQLALGNAVLDSEGRQIPGLEGVRIRQAAIQQQMKSTLGEAEELIKSSGNIDETKIGKDNAEALRRTIANGIHTGGHAAKATYLGGDMSDRVMAGKIKSDKDLDMAAVRRINKGKISPESFVSQDADALKRMAKVVASNGVKATPEDGRSEAFDIARLDEFIQKAQTASTDAILSTRISGEQAPHVQVITQKGSAPPSPTQPNTSNFEQNSSGLYIPRDRQ